MDKQEADASVDDMEQFNKFYEGKDILCHRLCICDGCCNIRIDFERRNGRKLGANDE